MTNNVHYSYIEKCEEHEGNTDYKENKDSRNPYMHLDSLRNTKYHFPVRVGTLLRHNPRQQSHIYFLPPICMTTAQRFLSLSMLTAMAIIAAPLASAHGFGQGLNDDQRDALRTELQSCRDANDTKEDRQACAQAVFSNNGIDAPARGPRGNNKRGERMGADLPDGAREALKTCHDENDNPEDMKACAQEIANQYDFELPEMGHRMRGRRGPMMRPRFQNLDDDTRAQIKECHDLEEKDETRSCMDALRDQMDTE